MSKRKTKAKGGASRRASVHAQTDTRLSRMLTVANSVQSDSVRRYGTTPEEIADILRGENNDDASGAHVTPDSSLRVAAVYACVALLSRSQAMLPLQLYKRDGKRHTLEMDHPVADLLSFAPNRWQSPYEFESMLTAHKALTGNAYALISRLGRRVQELIPLNPLNVKPVLRADMSLEYEYYRPDGRKVTYKQSDIHHRRGLSVDGVLGLSPVAAARRAIGLAMQTEKHGAIMFRNGAKPGGALKTDNQLTDDAYRRLQESFADDYGGVENAHKTLILEQGLAWEQISMTAEDSQFIESRKFQRSEIAMFYGVPPHMIGDVERGTSWGSGIEQQSLGFLTHTLQPYLVSDQQALVRDLLTPEERRQYVIKHDVSALTQVAFLPRQQGFEIQLRNGVISPNEWRIKEGENPREDEDGDAYQAPGSASQSFVESNGAEDDAATDENQDFAAA